jgi:hypothetical protein
VTPADETSRTHPVGMPHAEKLTSAAIGCPSGLHFHITAEDASTDGTLHQVIECTTPEDALSQFLPSIPPGWEGSVSVDDHETLHPSEVPLMDIWHRLRLRHKLTDSVEFQVRD